MKPLSVSDLPHDFELNALDWIRDRHQDTFMENKNE
jgi:hypothetical protein